MSAEVEQLPVCQVVLVVLGVGYGHARSLAVSQDDASLGRGHDRTVEVKNPAGGLDRTEDAVHAAVGHIAPLVDRDRQLAVDDVSCFDALLQQNVAVGVVPFHESTPELAILGVRVRKFLAAGAGPPWHHCNAIITDGDEVPDAAGPLVIGEAQ